jgi:hypothetical protein
MMWMFIRREKSYNRVKREGIIGTRLHESELPDKLVEIVREKRDI